MACLANQEQVFSTLDQLGVSSSALDERKIKKNVLCFDQSAFSNFALFSQSVLVIKGKCEIFVLILLDVSLASCS